MPTETEFGIFPEPGLGYRFHGGLVRVSRFTLGAGGTFTANSSGTLWFTPNDNLRKDNQGTYSVLVLSP